MTNCEDKLKLIEKAADKYSDDYYQFFNIVCDILGLFKGA